jgi:PAS domain S-box-containing protein
VIAEGREAEIRAQALLVVVAFSVAAGGAAGASQLAGGSRLLGALALAHTAAIATVPFVLRTTGSVALAGNLLVGLTFAMMTAAGSLLLGRGLAPLFLFLVPLFGILFCGRRAGLRWSVAAVAVSFALGLLAASNLPSPVDVPTDVLAETRYRTGFVAVLLSVAALFTYDAVKEAALRDRERAVKELRESRESYRQLVETSPDAIVVSSAGRLVFANPRAVELAGARSEAELLGRPVDEFVEPEHRDEVAQGRAQVEAGRALQPIWLRLRTLAGESLAVEGVATLTTFGGEPAILWLLRDRREQEATLARLRLLAAAMDESTDGVLMIDAAGIVRYANDTYARMRGIPTGEIVGRSYTELPRDADAARTIGEPFRRELAGSGGRGAARFTTRGAEGPRHTDVRAFPVRAGDGPITVALLRDVTREVELEESARQSQKMEALGQLAGGIAHDFNNHLTVILGHAESLRAACSAEPELNQDAEAVLEAARRSAALTRQLLAFARRQAAAVRVVNLNDVVRGLDDMLRRLLPARITLSVALVQDAAPVLADCGQLEQVVLNLVVNARDAIAGTGSIRIETATEGEGGARATVLRVADDGSGMEEAIRDRMFEPFFTTKPPGSGTGLGLSTVHGIVHQLEGEIAVDTAPGRGTTVSIRLPAAEGAPAADAVALPVAAAAGRGSGTVLLVEDDRGVRRLARRALEATGYRVLEAERGEEALAVAEREALDLVVTDLSMPGLGGAELADLLGQRLLGLPVLFISGYAEAASEIRNAHRPGRDFLEKPFRPDQLVERVQRLLGARRAGPVV